MGKVSELIEDKVENGSLGFAADSPTAVVRQASGGGEPRPAQPPATNIEDFRLIANTDPHVSEAIDTFVDYLVGAGVSIEPANVPGTDTEQTDEDIADIKRLIEVSSFERELCNWVWHALVDGTGFLELVVENEYFRPKVLPTEDIEIQTDEFGNIQGFIQNSASGDDIEFDPHEIAILRFHRHPDEDFGHSVIEPVQEQANILRDMEIDTARFVATKAYPPILWKLGSDERPRTEDQIESWLDNVEDIEPESMLAVSHDVEHEAVGVTSTSSTSGAMRLEETFNHFMKRVATGVGLPADLLNIETLSGQQLQVAMTKLDRRVQRQRKVIQDAIRYQIFPSLLADSTAVEYGDIPPEVEFGKHSSEEERLEMDAAIRLLNNNLLTFEATAKRLGIDPETELPDNVQDIDGEEQMRLLQTLAGQGDNIQNPEGGSPTDTGGGTQSAGREATTREDPSGDQSGDNARPQQGVTD